MQQQPIARRAEHAYPNFQLCAQLILCLTEEEILKSQLSKTASSESQIYSQPCSNTDYLHCGGWAHTGKPQVQKYWDTLEAGPKNTNSL